MASTIANDKKSRESLLVNLVRIFDSPLFVVFPADLMSIPPLSSLEALVSNEGRLPGIGRSAVDPSAYLRGVSLRTPGGVWAMQPVLTGGRRPPRLGSLRRG
jgi:hypothetical protein